MNKNLYINIEETIKEEERRRTLYGSGSSHQMVQNGVGQLVDTHINMGEVPLTEFEIGRGQVEVLLRLQTDSDTLRIIENVETENEVLDRIQWGKKKKKKSKRVVY